VPATTSHRFNVTDYYRLAEIGVLQPDAQVELLDGQVVDSFRISPLHAAVTRLVAQPFFALPEERCIVSVRNPVRLDEYNELQPDVMLLKYIPNYYKVQHPGPADVFLLIEVADASLDYDREQKLPAYGRAGIAEVWLVNLPDQTIEVYREPHFTGYNSKTILRAGDHAAPCAFHDASVDVSALLKH
jgi:Uma2 family endonuclease